MKVKYLIVGALLLITLGFFLAFMLVPKLSIGLVQMECPSCDEKSAIQIAAQLGRLDVVSLALGFLGIGVGFFAIFSFFSVKEDAGDQARKVADDFFSQRWGQLSRKIDNQIDAKLRMALSELAVGYDINDVDIRNRTEVKEDE